MLNEAFIHISELSHGFIKGSMNSKIVLLYSALFTRDE
jgi:hypothetical protein